MAVATEREYGLFIAGEFAEPASGEVRELSEPASGEPLARAAMANEVLEDDVRVSEDDGRPQRVMPFTRKELLGPLERWFFGRRA